MAYKDILLHLDRSASCADRTALALALAGAQDAHLTGLFTAVAPQWPAEVYTHLSVDLLEQQRQESVESGQAVVQDFTQQALDAGLSAEGRVETTLEVDLAGTLARHGRSADLLVIGQAEPDDPLSNSPQLVEAVIMAAGCPTLMVPYVGCSAEAGKRIMVAWDGGREAARAIHDALPLLTKAETVMVLTVDPKHKANQLGEEPGADVALHLARHGCRVELQSAVSGSVGIGDTILSRLADQGVDLLVMGAYGHSRLRELVLGGATRHILAHMTVPVLMSH